MAGTWRNQRGLLRLLALMLVLAMALVACGDDDDDEAETGAATTAAEEGGGDVEAYCDKVFELETFPEPEIDFESLTPEQQKEEVKKFVTEDFGPAVEEIEPLIPEEIKADAAILTAGIDKVKETGDFESFEGDPQVQAAQAKVHAYDLDNCGWQQVDVTATEYKFEGVPPTLEAGPTSFDLSNKGKEPHELVVLRINDDFEGSFADILKLPEEEAMQKTKGVGGTFAEPSEAEYLVTELEAGRYALACFVPVGGGEEGPPHTSQGMFVEFEVS
jgi:hypothetical protein